MCPIMEYDASSDAKNKLAKVKNHFGSTTYNTLKTMLIQSLMEYGIAYVVAFFFLAAHLCDVEYVIYVCRRRVHESTNKL